LSNRGSKLPAPTREAQPDLGNPDEPDGDVEKCASAGAAAVPAIAEDSAAAANNTPALRSTRPSARANPSGRHRWLVR